MEECNNLLCHNNILYLTFLKVSLIVNLVYPTSNKHAHLVHSHSNQFLEFRWELINRRLPHFINNHIRGIRFKPARLNLPRGRHSSSSKATHLDTARPVANRRNPFHNRLRGRK
jgi:hypothetical protein